jgi:hypothetical protein
VPGEKLGDLLEGRAPRFDEVVQIAARQLNVFRARYVIGGVLAPRGRDKYVIGVLDNEGRRADCREDRPHVQFADYGQHEGAGRRARRQPLLSRPRCPDLLVPRHVRIDQMLELAGPPCAFIDLVLVDGGQPHGECAPVDEGHLALTAVGSNHPPNGYGCPDLLPRLRCWADVSMPSESQIGLRAAHRRY